MKKQIIIVKSDLKQFPDEETRGKFVSQMTDLIRNEVQRQGISILICDKSQFQDVSVIEVDI